MPIARDALVGTMGLAVRLVKTFSHESVRRKIVNRCMPQLEHDVGPITLGNELVIEKGSHSDRKEVEVDNIVWIA
jgi:hypothetical protein